SCNMKAPCAGAVRTSSDQNHSDRSGKVGDGSDETDDQIAHPGKCLHDLRKPQADAVETHDDREVNERQRPYAPALKCLAERVVPAAAHFSGLSIQFR